MRDRTRDRQRHNVKEDGEGAEREREERLILHLSIDLFFAHVPVTPCVFLCLFVVQVDKSIWG